MEKKNNEIFGKIIETRSLTVIHMIADEALADCNPSDHAIFRQIGGLNSLDEIWIICHSRIANWHLSQAGTIRTFLDGKRGKKQ